MPNAVQLRQCSTGEHRSTALSASYHGGPCVCVCVRVCVCTERDGREATALLLRARAIADVLCRPDGKADDSPDGVADEDKAASSWAAGCSALRRGPSSCDSRVSCGCLLSPACSACCRGMSEYFCCCCCCCCCDCCCCCCCCCCC